MQHPAFWCIRGSENKQLLTGADPERTARGEGWVGMGDAEGVDVRGAQGAEPKKLKASSGGKWGRGFRLPNRLRSLGESRELLSEVRGGALTENGFQCFPSVTECFSLRCVS